MSQSFKEWPKLPIKTPDRMILNPTVVLVPWIPTKIGSSLLLWLDASDTSTITTATGVSNWADKSGKGNNASQASANLQPVVTANELNSNSVITFDGVNDFISTPRLLTALPYTIATVVKPVSCGNTGQGNGIFYQGSGSNALGTVLSVTNNTGAPNLAAFHNEGGSFVVSSNNAISTSAFQILLITLNASGTAVIRVNGTQVGTGTSGTTTPSNNTTKLGYWYNSSDSTRYFKGSMAETIVSNEISSYQNIEGHLAHKWGLSGSLPSNHPYKNNPPMV